MQLNNANTRQKEALYCKCVWFSEPSQVYFLTHVSKTVRDFKQTCLQKKSMLNNACETLSTQAIHVCIYIYDILTELVVTC